MFPQIALSNETGQTRILFAEINTNNVTDIQSRVSEALIIVIEKLDGGFPRNNYVVKIRQDDNMHIGKLRGMMSIRVFFMIHSFSVGTVDMLSSGIFSAAFNIIVDFAMYLDEIRDLSVFGDMISKMDEDVFINYYKNALLKNSNETFIELPVYNDRFLTAISPKFRNSPPLKHDLNDSQIILCLCHLSTRTNYLHVPFRETFYHLKDICFVRNDLQYGVLGMSPHNLTQSKFNGFILDAVRFNCGETCNIDRTNTTMLWDNVVSYSKSILQSDF